MASTQDDQPPPTSLPSSSSTLPPPEYYVADFKHNFEAALDVVTPRIFAAITTLSEAPNPLLQAVKRFEEGGNPYERIGLGLPLQESQIQEFRIMRLLVQDQRLGGEAIRSKDLEILNVKWTTWIQSSVERLIGEKFGIRGTTVHFEGALVVTDKKAAQFFANEYAFFFPLVSRNVGGIRLTNGLTASLKRRIPMALEKCLPFYHPSENQSSRYQHRNPAKFAHPNRTLRQRAT
jgi:hypothetical protein